MGVPSVRTGSLAGMVAVRVGVADEAVVAVGLIRVGEGLGVIVEGKVGQAVSV